MTKCSFISAVFIYLSFSSLSGQSSVFVLHPSVGDTIDLEERNNYLLFSGYDFGQANEFVILKSNAGFELQALQNNTLVKTMPLNNQEVNQYAANIEKINRYWDSQVAKDSIPSDSLTSGLEQPAYESLDLDLISPAVIKEIKGAIKVEWHRQKALERIDNIKKGHMF